MEDSLILVVEAGVGLAGFSGITVALSGDTKNWTFAERLRIGNMLFHFFFSVFMAFTFIVVSEAMDEESALRVSSAVAALVWIVAMAYLLRAAVPLFKSPTAIYNPYIASFITVSNVIAILFLIANTFGFFTNTGTPLIGALVWSLLIGAFNYVRILFIRPGMADHEGA